MSKRKKPDSEVPTGAEDIEINEALLGFDDDGLPEDGLPGEDGFDDSELGDLEDALGDDGGEEGDDDGEEGDDGGEEEDDGDGDGDDGGGELPPETEDDATLPVDASELEAGEEVDLSAHTLSTAQARLIAPHLVQNGDLAKLKLATSTLSISDLKEDDELEWDSEEYTDVEAIIIAECVHRRRPRNSLPQAISAQLRPESPRVTAHPSCSALDRRYLKASLPKLERLDLARNQISDAGARALSAAIAVNTTLEYLNLESNVVAEKGGEVRVRVRIIVRVRVGL